MYEPLLKPKHQPRGPRPWLVVMPDGREILDTRHSQKGRDEYKARIWAMWERQGGRCALCGKKMAREEATFDHQDGRGAGGSRRDDRIMKDGERYNAALDARCNFERGSTRAPYRYQ